jgi:hypothetical protein
MHLNVKLRGCKIDQNKLLTEIEIGQNFLIPIPNVDRGKRDPRNVMADCDLSVEISFSFEHY